MLNQPYDTLINNALKDDLITLYFQPVIRSVTEKIMHHAMLLRLQAQDGELIMPNVLYYRERFGLLPQVAVGGAAHMDALKNSRLKLL